MEATLIARHARLLAKQDRAQIALFPGVDRMLTQLHAASILLAVVSSINEETVRHVLEPESAARITYYACGSSIFGKQAHVRRVLKRSGGFKLRKAVAVRHSPSFAVLR